MNLTLVKSESFNGVTCDFYQGKNDIWMTREQIGEALEYEHPRKAIEAIHRRHSSRLDRFSVVVKLKTTDGKMYETYLYSAKGVYEICRWSRQPKADAFMDFVWEVVESLRTGRLFDADQVLRLLHGFNDRLAAIEAKLDTTSLTKLVNIEGGRKVLRRHYAVERLPADLRSLVDRALEDGVYYRDIAAMLAAKGYKIGKSSIARYGKQYLADRRREYLARPRGDLILLGPQPGPK